ncbi:hypothetical protein [Saccharopolyspora sp. ASAGF58]|uniref:hypothetical protein n=1 Tax=Saccharopolyspora sp. ASAGF58 TaxID=2719023 RepID=UPI00143FE747|nr:hypothetical protein [Saccharopolyspora sp. ASAGF58]QIZ35910.1 hypothetical protein FDZ84_15950 [Saccharopolyspora sp. ASAGF58]
MSCPSPSSAAQQPDRVDGGHGWALDVAPDGRIATVRAPATLRIIALDGGAATLELAKGEHR